MRNCKPFETLLALHVENDLSTEESAVVERHLAKCPDCRRDLVALVESQSFFLEVRGRRVPDDVARDVRRRVLDRIEQNPGRVLGWQVRIERAVLAGVRRPLAIATTCGLAVVIVVVWTSVPDRVVVDEPVAAIEAPLVGDTPPGVQPTVTPERAVEPAEAIVMENSATDVAGAVASAPLDVPVAIDWNADPVEIDIPPQRTVKLVTDDPKVIIYWVLDEGNEGGGA